MCKWVLEEAENIWEENLDVKYFLAFICEKMAREYRAEDISNRLLILKAESLYENIIENFKENYLAKYNVSRLALERLEEYHNSFEKNTLTPLDYKKDEEKFLNTIQGRYRRGSREIPLEEEYFKVLNSTETQLESNGKIIVDEAIEFLDRYKPEDFSNRYYDYSKLLVKSNFILKNYKKCIEYLNTKRDLEFYSDDFLMRGVCNYSLKNYNKANKDFNKAIRLMDKETRDDFIVNSFGIILNQKYGSKFPNADLKTKQQYIMAYLRIRDPLYLTSQNERLLEHFYRVAYANLFFSFDIDNRRDKEKGWLTERGEIFIRYGEPSKILRLRPQADVTEDVLDKSAKYKTEVWLYPTKKFAFVDKFLNNRYTFAEDAGHTFGAQNVENTNDFVQSYREKTPEEYMYNPKGEILNVSFKLYQLQNLDKEYTDVILAYSMNEKDSIKELFGSRNYNAGLFLVDDYTNIIDSKLQKSKIKNDETANNNYLNLTLEPCKANVSFEVIRENDKGAFFNKGKVELSDFSNSDLMISDIVIADKIEYNKTIQNSIKRNNISVLPTANTFIKDKDFVWIYFEIYNLELDNRLNKFTQSIEIEQIDEDGSILDSFTKLADFIGLSENSDLEITSNYQSSKDNEQIFLKLDLSDIDNGNYRIKVKVNDLLADETVVKSINIVYEN